MRLLKKVVDFIEIFFPSVLFVVLFLSFIAGIVFRYILKDPQSWTFELGTVSFVVVGLLSCNIAHRKEDHVVFDLIYDKMSPKAQNIFRIIGNMLIVIFISIIVPASIKYLITMQEQGLVTQILKIPRYIVFLPMTIMFCFAVVRSGYRLIMDIKSLKEKTFVKMYNVKDEETLI